MSTKKLTPSEGYDVFPNIVKTEFTTTESTLKDTLLHSWVRVKLHKKWYEVHVRQTYEGVQLTAVSEMYQNFVLSAYDKMTFTTMTKKAIKEGLKEGFLRDSYFPFSEKSRLYSV